MQSLRSQKSRFMHIEQHFTGSKIIRDLVLGVSDGLTVPFALAAGLAGAELNHWTIIIAALAEIAAGSIAMGLGGYLATKSEADTYSTELEREYRETEELPHHEEEEVREVFSNYGLNGETLESAVHAIISNKEAWVKFMMREELGLEYVDPKRALPSGLTIGGAYIAGGIFPLLPYFSNQISTHQALLISMIITLMALGLFGWVKAKFTGVNKIRSAFQTVIVGGIASGVAFGVAKLITNLAPHPY
ncbi:MAG: VIT1/CCC1 transporter family protein [Deltaproteobacteria bacterium]|nr:VIT1/CCC1 transporter family protein [Deltaproteobacteria bacterium]